VPLPVRNIAHNYVHSLYLTGRGVCKAGHALTWAQAVSDPCWGSAPAAAQSVVHSVVQSAVGFVGRPVKCLGGCDHARGQGAGGSPLCSTRREASSCLGTSCGHGVVSQGVPTRGWRGATGRVPANLFAGLADSRPAGFGRGSCDRRRHSWRSTAA
jgi:hypothetical protein